MKNRRQLRAFALACAACFGACNTTIVEPKLPPAWTSVEAEHPLSRVACIDLALRSAPNHAAWQARSAAARANLDQAKLVPNPTLSLAWEDFGLNAAAQHNQVQSTLSLAMALADLFSRKSRTKIAQHELLVEEGQLAVEIAQVSSEVARSYDRIVAARARVALSHELANVADVQNAAMAKMVAAGQLPAIERKRAEAEVVQSQSQVAATEAQARALELEFAFALGFERPVALALGDGLSRAQRSGEDDLEPLLASAALHRPELLVAGESYAAELERLHLTVSPVRFLPIVGVGPRIQGNELRGVATIDAVLPIFDTGAVAKKSQEAALLAAAARVRAAAQSVASEVCSALERRRAAAEFLDGHARELSLRRRRLREDSERLFNAGELEYSALVQARRDEVESRQAELDAELSLALAEIDLDAALGATAFQAR